MTVIDETVGGPKLLRARGEVVELGLPSTADEWLDPRGRELDLECIPKRKDC
jgi:hypothetical protein